MFLNLLALDIFIECTKADSIKNSFQFPGLHFPTLWADPCSWCYAAARLVDAGDLDMFLNYRCASWGVRLKNTSIQKQYSSCAFYFFGNLNFRHRLGLWLKPINSHFKISPNFDYMVSFVPKKKSNLHIYKHYTNLFYFSWLLVMMLMALVEFAAVDCRWHWKTLYRLVKHFRNLIPIRQYAASVRGIRHTCILPCI